MQRTRSCSDLRKHSSSCGPGHSCSVIRELLKSLTHGQGSPCREAVCRAQSRKMKLQLPHRTAGGLEPAFMKSMIGLELMSCSTLASRLCPLGAALLCRAEPLL